MKKAIIGAQVFDGETLLNDMAIVMNGEQIVAVVAADQLTDNIDITELNGGIVAPGFIDLQVNGGGGVMLNNHPTTAGLKRMIDGHRATGTTAMLPTLISDSAELHQRATAAIRTCSPERPGLLGVHIEGPFFSLERRGAHLEGYIREPETADIDWLCSLASPAEPGNLSDLDVMVTLAPERCQAGQIQRLSEAGIRVCAGHSNATSEQVDAALNEGLQGFTHLYNAMRPLQGREPGVVGAALNDPDSYCGIIVDGHHVHPTAIQLAYKSKPRGKLYLVTDAMATVGSADKSFEIYGETVHEENGRIVNAEGRLAGSAIGMIEAVKLAHQLAELPLTECLRMASLYPAQFIEQDHRLGRIRADYRADLVHFNRDFVVQNTWVAGDRQAHQPSHSSSV